MESTEPTMGQDDATDERPVRRDQLFRRAGLLPAERFWKLWGVYKRLSAEGWEEMEAPACIKAE